MTPDFTEEPVATPVLSRRAVGLVVIVVAVASAAALRRGDGQQDASLAPAGATREAPRGAQVPGVVAEELYTVAFGDTLSSIAARHGTTVAALKDLNGLEDPDALTAGQELRITRAPQGEGPDIPLVPASEVVYGPAYLGFDVEDAVTRAGGWLASAWEPVDGTPLTGPRIVARVAREYSVGPRVLLAFVQATSGSVLGMPPTRLVDYPAGHVRPERTGLWRQLSWLADELNDGYYDWRTRDSRLMVTLDGVALAGHPTLGPGSYAVHQAMARISPAEELDERLRAFDAAYRRLFGDPWSDALPLTPVAGRAFPELTAPWGPGETWWFTGGSHGGWAQGSAWGAVDFVPDAHPGGCVTASAWATAVADGVVIDGGAGLVWLDIDGDGARETGPVVAYMHMASAGRAPHGARLATGDPVGRPSCEGGVANAAHLHLARLLDGEWLSVAGPPALQLGDWRFAHGAAPYEGTATHRSGIERRACECRAPGHNDLDP